MMELHKIMNLNDKTSQKTGKQYKVLVTDKAEFSVFDFKLINEIPKYFGNFAQLDIEQKGNFRNLKNIYPVGSEVQQTASQNISPQTVKPVGNFTDNMEQKNACMLTSYCKDLAVEVLKIKAQTISDNNEPDIVAIMKDCAQATSDAYEIILGNLKEKPE